METANWIMAISSSVLMVITGWYAYLTHKMLKSNEKSNEEQLRPYIVFHIFSLDHWLNMSITNIGKRAAKDIEITIDPPLDNIDVNKNNNQAANRELLNQSFMPPDFKIETILMDTIAYLNKNDKETKYSVTVKYKSLEGKQYTETYIINLAKYIIGEKAAKYSQEYYLTNITKSIDKVSEAIKKHNK